MRTYNEIRRDLEALEVENDGNNGGELIHVTGWYPHSDGVQATRYCWTGGRCHQRETILTKDIAKWDRLFDELVDSIEF